MSEPAADRLERDLVDAVLSAPAEQRREERDLAHLLWVAEELEPARTGLRLLELIDDRLLLVRWMSGSMFERNAGDGPPFYCRGADLPSASTRHG